VSPIAEHPAAPERSGASAGRILLSLLLLAPIAMCWLGTLLFPTLQTVSTSFQDARILGRDPAEQVGWANYERLSEDRVYAAARDFTLSLATTRVLAVAIVPLLLGLALGVFGRGVRVPVRLLFTIPLALFAPVVTALAWSLALAPQISAFPSISGADGRPEPWLSSAELAPAALRLVDALSSFGLACGIGLIIYGAALRGPGSAAPVWSSVRRPLLITWAVVVLATIGLALQSFSLSLLMTNGGPARSTVTLALLQHISAFMQARFGLGAAVATPVLVALGALGLLAGLLIILGGVQIEAVPPGKPPLQISQPSRPLAAVALLILTAGAIAACLIGGWPLIWTALNSLKTMAEIFSSDAGLLPAAPSLEAYRELDEVLGGPMLLVSTLLPPMIAVAVQLQIAYLGALAIGGLRPLGRRSEWLLLPFSPWLFVGVGPLSLAAFQSRASLDLLNTLPALVTPILCSVPMLFILTLFFKGQSARRLAGGESFFGALILPSLPLAALLASVALLVELQQLQWPLLVAAPRGATPFTVMLAQLRGQFASEVPLISAAAVRFELPIFIVFFLVFALFQIFYIDRLAITRDDGR
jgi:ABC-type sugar transport system permease subunit